MLSSSSVVHLKILFGAQKDSGCRTSRTLLQDHDGVPFGGRVNPGIGCARSVCAACPSPLDRPSSAPGIPHAGVVAQWTLKVA
jgi:hypothetical protein